MNERSMYEDLLRLPGLKIERIEPLNRRINIYGRVDEGPQPCPTCNEATDLVHQYTHREIRDLDISGRQVWLHLEMKQYECVVCRNYFTQLLSWADKAKSYTRRQAKFIFEMCEHQAYSQVGALFDMNAKSVERLYLAYAQQSCDLAKRFAQVRRLGIDELSHRKGKKDFCCVLTDLDRGIHLDILPDRKKATLQAYFEKLGMPWCSQITAVSCDMWSPYIDLAERFFPQADICIDRFHVVVLLNKGLDTLRRKLRNQAPTQEAFKSIKWQLYKRPDNLSYQEEQDLAKAFESSIELNEMYALRNEFHRIFDKNTDHWTALLQLNEWMKNVETSSIGEYWKSFLTTLKNWKGYILNFVNTRLTNAATEGLNNLIRHLKRISFGMPNFQHMRWRVLARME